MWSGSTEPCPAVQGAPETLWAREVARPVAPPRRPERDDSPHPPEGERCAVRIIDNPVNTCEEVTVVCAQVLGVSLDEGFQIACTVDHGGSCIVGAWPRAEPRLRRGTGIAAIGIEVRVEPERN